MTSVMAEVRRLLSGRVTAAVSAAMFAMAHSQSMKEVIGMTWL